VLAFGAFARSNWDPCTAREETVKEVSQIPEALQACGIFGTTLLLPFLTNGFLRERRECGNALDLEPGARGSRGPFLVGQGILANSSVLFPEKAV